VRLRRRLRQAEGFETFSVSRDVIENKQIAIFSRDVDEKIRPSGVKNEGASGDVYENKETGDKMPDNSGAF